MREKIKKNKIFKEELKDGCVRKFQEIAEIDCWGRISMIWNVNDSRSQDYHVPKIRDAEVYELEVPGIGNSRNQSQKSRMNQCLTSKFKVMESLTRLARHSDILSVMYSSIFVNFLRQVDIAWNLSPCAIYFACRNFVKINEGVWQVQSAYRSSRRAIRFDMYVLNKHF